MTDQYYLGIDLGSSSIKVALTNSNGVPIAQTKYPEEEMNIIAHEVGWAEQDPTLWYAYVLKAIASAISDANISAKNIKSIGISYQMHGLVCLNKSGDIVRPSIIWCDSRAVQVGDNARAVLGDEYCFSHLLNAPGNFTASKLRWVKEHEPSIYETIRSIMLPGDYIAYRMSGELSTTKSGLSEGIFWDFTNNEVSTPLLNAFGFDRSIIPAIIDSFDDSIKTNKDFETVTGISAGTPIAYRAGDQPNNALAMGVLDHGEAAGTGGTSGVVYAVSEHVNADNTSKVNTFAHVNHTSMKPHLGTLLCINGTGILYNWVRSNFFDKTSYVELEQIAAAIPAGSEGVLAYSFGNGAERMLGNRQLGASFEQLSLTRHTKAHMLRAGLEGIAFAFAFGLEAMANIGIDVKSMRVGNDNLFQSKVFGQTLANVANIHIDRIDTSGAVGAAIGGAYGAGHVANLKQMLQSASNIGSYVPNSSLELNQVYHTWKDKISQ